MTVVGVLKGVLGLAVLIGIAWIFSSNRKKIDWRLVGMGLLIQLVLAVCIIKVPFIESAFEAVSAGFVKVISFTNKGTEFLFSSFISGEVCWKFCVRNCLVLVGPVLISWLALGLSEFSKLFLTLFSWTTSNLPFTSLTLNCS